MSSNPVNAEETISLPSFIASGFPELVKILEPPNSIRRKAIPPAIPIAMVKITLNNSAGSEGIHPRSVFIPFFPLIVHGWIFPGTDFPDTGPPGDVLHVPPPTEGVHP